MATEPSTSTIGRVPRQKLILGSLQSKVDQRIASWQQSSFSRAMWSKDYKLWSAKPQPEITNRMGWLTLPDLMKPHIGDMERFASEIRGEEFQHVALLGMGGSSLAPEVFQMTFGNAPGYPEVRVLDSTHPESVRTTESAIDVSKTLFVVSSKSGGTLEVLSFFRYFWDRVSKTNSAPGRQFIAITDPGTSLEALAKERGFRRVFLAASDVGGRYSALTAFGLVPAALIGVNLSLLLDRARIMATACESWESAGENPGLLLGAALGELALAGRDKVTFIGSSKTEAFSCWAEQLIAESTGKSGKGILPVADEPVGDPAAYGGDRVFVAIEIEGEVSGLEAPLNLLESAGIPIIRIRLGDIYDLGQEFFRWEVATAAASSVLGVHPFNQPDVELAKDHARKSMAAAASGEKPSVPAAKVRDGDSLDRALREALTAAPDGSYIALQAYLAPTKEANDALQSIRRVLRDRTKFATTLGWGPRFLHSTGQLHKGGPNTGIFLQLIDEAGKDLPVPESGYTFATLIGAQAAGDYQALVERGRKVLRVDLGSDTLKGIALLSEAVQRVLPG